MAHELPGVPAYRPVKGKPAHGTRLSRRFTKTAAKKMEWATPGQITLIVPRVRPLHAAPQ